MNVNLWMMVHETHRNRATLYSNMIPQLYGKSEETGVFWLTCSFRYSTGTSLWKRNDCHYEILAKNTISVRT